MPPTMLLNSLQSVRRRVKVLGVAYGLGIVLAAAVGLLLATIFLDYILNLPGTPRLVFIFLALAGTVYAVVRWVVQPALKQLSLSDIAGRLEQAFPQFNDRLRSTVDFIRSDDIPGSAMMKDRVVSETTSLAQRLDLAQAVVATPAYYSLAGGVGAILLAVTLALFSQNYASVAFSRLLHPFTPMEWPKRVQIELTGDLPSRVPVGQRVEVRMKLTRGDSSSRRAIIHYQYDDGPVQSEIMTRGADGTYGSSLDARVDSGKGAASLKIWMQAGDDEKQLAPITVVPRLAIKSVEAELKPPAYVNADKTTSVNLLTAPAMVADGSQVTLHIGFNKVLATNNPVKIEAASQEMTAPDVKWTADTASSIAGTWMARKTLRFHIVGTDVDGFSNNALEEYEVIVRPDQIPSVQIENPRRNEERTIASIVPLVGVAEDDYGLEYVKLGIERVGDKKSWSIPLININEAASTDVSLTRAEGALDRLRFRAGYQWDLSKLPDSNLKAGDVLEYYLLAKDNFNLDGQTHPEVTSGRLRITLITPDDLVAKVIDDLRQLKNQIQGVRNAQESTRQQTQELAHDTRQRPQLDQANRAALGRITNQQATNAAQTMQIAGRIAELRDQLTQNGVNSQELADLTRDVTSQLEQAAQNPMRQASRQLANANPLDRPNPSTGQPNNADRVQQAGDNPQQQNQQPQNQDQQAGSGATSRPAQASRNGATSRPGTSGDRNNADQQQQLADAQQQNAGDQQQQSNGQQQQRDGANQQNSGQRGENQQANSQQQNGGQQQRDGANQQNSGQRGENQQANGQQQNGAQQQQANGQQQQRNGANPQNSGQRGENQQANSQQQNGQQQQRDGANPQNAGQRGENQQANGQQQNGQQQNGQQQNGQQQQQQASGQQQSGQQQNGGQQQQSGNPQQANGQQQRGGGQPQQQSGGQQNGQQQQGDQQQPQQDQQPLSQADQQQRDQALAQAMQEQQQANEQLDKALDRMASIGSVQQQIQKLRDILNQQQRISQQTRQIGRDNVGKTPEQMNQQDRDKLNQNADEQQRLSQDTQRAMDEMQRMAQQMQRSDPTSSQAMQRAAQSGQRQQTAQNQQRASDQARQNQQSQAQNSQRQAEMGLDDMLNQLNQAERTRLAELQKQLEELANQIDILIRRQAGHNLDDLSLQGQAKLAGMDVNLIADLMGKAERQAGDKPDVTEVGQLSTSQEQTGRNTRDLGKTAADTQNGAEPAAHLTRAAGRMDRAIVSLRATKLDEAYDPAQVDALAELDQARQNVAEQQQQVDQQIQDQQREGLRQRYIKIRDDQAKLNEETAKIDKSRNPDGGLTRLDTVRLGQMPGEQGGLADKVNGIGEDLAGINSTVYLWANKDIAQSMNDVKADLGKQTTGVATQSEQTRIAEQLDAMIKNLQTRPRTSRFAQQGDGQQQQQQGGGGGQQQQRIRLPGEAELRLLQDLQRAVNKSTKTINDQPDKDQDKPKLLALGGRQGDLRGLLDDLLQKASRGQLKLGPEPDVKQQLPEEANPEQVEDQELQQQLLQGKPDQDASEKQANLIGDRMARSRQRLADKSDPGQITQLIQKRILDDFDSLIQQAQEQQAQTQNAQQRRQQQQQQGQQARAQQRAQQAQRNQGQPQNQGQQQGDRSQDNQSNQGAAASLRPGAQQVNTDTSKQIDQSAAEWGQVSPRLRQAVIDGENEKIMEDYRRMTEEYFRSVADKGAGQ